MDFKIDSKKRKVSKNDDEQTSKRQELIASIENLDVNRAHQLLLENGINEVNSIYLSRLLMRAIETGNEQLVKDLLMKDPKLKTESGKSVLWEAVLTGAMKVASMLVRNGADLAERHNFSNFLHVLVSSNDRSKHKLAMLMLDHGADPSVKDAVGNTVLHYAVRIKSSSLTLKLLEKGAKIDIKNKYGESVLAQAACMLEARQWVDMLLENGTTSIMTQNPEERKRLCIRDAIMGLVCQKNANLNAIRILCASNGFDVRRHGNNHNSSLVVNAIFKGAETEVIELLIELGSDLTMCNDLSLKYLKGVTRVGYFIKRRIIEMHKSNKFLTNQGYVKFQDLRKFHDRCLTETRRMEKDMVNDNLSVIQILTTSNKSLSWMIRNTNLIRDYTKIRNRIGTLYRLYFADLETAFTEAKKRHEILALKEEAFTDKLKDFLPELVLEKIFFYLYMENIPDQLVNNESQVAMPHYTHVVSFRSHN